MSDLLDHAPCGFVLFGDDGTIGAVNVTFTRMLGMTKDELEGSRFQDLLSSGGRIFYQTHLFPMLKLQGEVEEIYLSLRSKAGVEIPMLLNARRREGKSGAIIECIFVRMRQRARLEQELVKARETAERETKSKDNFLAALSHELRTPLNPMLLLSTEMEMDSSLPAEVREQAGIIRRNAQLEASLIDDLLDITRITHQKVTLSKTVVDLHALLSLTEEVVQGDAAEKRIAIRFEKGANEYHTLGDLARLQQVFWNLVKNAIKFTPAGGEVRITTENDSSNRFRARIVDTGIGIEAEGLARIFNAFEQGQISRQEFGGLGLGLAIAHSIVEMHEGTIHAESAGHGTGATFIVELVTCEKPQTAPEQVAPIASKTQIMRLLLVEDHEPSRAVMTRILRRAGHEVHSVDTAKEAVELAASGIKFDALISDLGLPDESGLELMRKLRAKYRLPGIALSGYGMDEDLQQARDAGFCAHLVKPVVFDQLRAILGQIASGALH